jgi:NAD(P)-dependent dehydrogenase (short-subunit alcohol dehydrogenase family)
VQISSLLGRITLPFYGPYNASKWALEALSENYRTELSQFGIDVAIVEPGGFPTNFMERLVHPSDPSRHESYGEFAEAPATAFAEFEQALKANPAQDPQLVADAVAQVINTPAGKREFRTPVDRMGMSEPIKEYNQHLAQLTDRIYTAFGTQDMLTLKTK